MNDRVQAVSHPAWVCGLKRIMFDDILDQALSHPAWVCGLKLCGELSEEFDREVTPCVGVWIETILYRPEAYPPAQSHPAWVCGLKLPIQ